MLPIIDQEIPAEGEEGGTFVDTPSDVPFQNGFGRSYWF